MSGRTPSAAQFTTNISNLITEIQAHIRAQTVHDDREFRYQREAFDERRHQADELAETFRSDSKRFWNTRSGDARRIQTALRHSLAYFRSRRKT